MFKTVGFIGCGNMGGALARAAAKNIGVKIILYDTDSEKARELSKEIGGEAGDLSAAAGCDCVFLGVKPQIIDGVLKSLAPLINKSTLLVSMAAGVAISRIRAIPAPIIRIMPNLAASVGEAMILWAADGADENQKADFCALLSPAGQLLNIEESKIDAASAISGCGPAYAFMFAEALADAGVSIGLRREDALLLAAQTLLGSARLMLDTKEHPEALKDRVCSPGGTTIAGVLALERGGFRAACANAVISAYEKTKKL